MKPVLRIAVSLGIVSVLPSAMEARQPSQSIQTITRDAVGRVVEENARRAQENARPAVAGADKRHSSNDSDWSDVRDTEGEEIVLTLKGLPPVSRYVLGDSVNDSGLTVLNLADIRIPAEAREALADAAWWHPEYFSRPQPIGGVRLSKHVRIEAGSVFVDGNKVIDLSDIVEFVARTSVAEISHVHRATKRGLVWGVLSGAAAGVAIVTASCGTHWNRETPSCPNLTAAWLFLGPGVGAGIGAVIGAGIQISTVVYRAP